MYIYIYIHVFIFMIFEHTSHEYHFCFGMFFFSTFYGSSCCFFPKNRGKFSGTPALSLGSNAPTAYLVYLESNAGWIVAQRDMVFSSIFKMLFWVPRQSQELLAS